MKKPRARALPILGGLAVLAVGGFAAYLAISGTPLIDEWQCGDGEAPVLRDDGPGSFCEEEGSELPAGTHWDPLGNRPLTCEDRWGWVQVVPSGAASDADPDCFPDDRELPTGWQLADTAA
ncbi:hypothetical protein [Nocardioides sp. zg-DK7169]|uniref:hypothetical protein n=1 Tax=Nocardioides sp. zg-DK7169 TaxID=2736600 RepID=UPI00155603C8|nr:hypothetical protein [Nocardioides sp. zg-DK7169]NPC95926.1 hypothetical protein [Nocardioides sp. zg-DK7169]